MVPLHLSVLLDQGPELGPETINWRFPRLQIGQSETVEGLVEGNQGPQICVPLREDLDPLLDGVEFGTELCCGLGERGLDGDGLGVVRGGEGEESALEGFDFVDFGGSRSEGILKIRDLQGRPTYKLEDLQEGKNELGGKLTSSKKAVISSKGTSPFDIVFPFAPPADFLGLPSPPAGPKFLPPLSPFAGELADPPPPPPNPLRGAGICSSNSYLSFLS